MFCRRLATLAGDYGTSVRSDSVLLSKLARPLRGRRATVSSSLCRGKTSRLSRRSGQFLPFRLPPASLRPIATAGILLFRLRSRRQQRSPTANTVNVQDAGIDA